MRRPLTAFAFALALALLPLAATTRAQDGDAEAVSIRPAAKVGATAVHEATLAIDLAITLVVATKDREGPFVHDSKTSITTETRAVERTDAVDGDGVASLARRRWRRWREVHHEQGADPTVTERRKLLGETIELRRVDGRVVATKLESTLGKRLTAAAGALSIGEPLEALLPEKPAAIGAPWTVEGERLAAILHPILAAAATGRLEATLERVGLVDLTRFDAKAPVGAGGAGGPPAAGDGEHDVRRIARVAVKLSLRTRLGDAEGPELAAQLEGMILFDVEARRIARVRLAGEASFAQRMPDTEGGRIDASGAGTITIERRIREPVGDEADGLD